MLYPAELKYRKTDEWVKIENGIATIGITDFAQDSLSDVVYIEFDVDPDDVVEESGNMATIESVKAAAEVVFPIGGKVIEINQTLTDTPEVLNSAPYTDGWLVKLKVDDLNPLDKLMTAEEYEAYCQDR